MSKYNSTDFLLKELYELRSKKKEMCTIEKVLREELKRRIISRGSDTLHGREYTATLKICPRELIPKGSTPDDVWEKYKVTREVAYLRVMRNDT